MKQVFILSLVLLTACYKPPVPQPDPDNNSNTGSSVYPGEWSYSTIEMENGTLTTAQQQLGTFTGTGKDIKGNFSIKADHTFKAVLSYTAAVEANVFGQTVPQEIPVEERTIEGSWSESAGKISFSPNDGTKTTVFSSSATQIVFGGNFEQQMTMGQFSVDATADVQITIVK